MAPVFIVQISTVLQKILMHSCILQNGIFRGWNDKFQFIVLLLWRLRHPKGFSLSKR